MVGPMSADRLGAGAGLALPFVIFTNSRALSLYTWASISHAQSCHIRPEGKWVVESRVVFIIAIATDNHQNPTLKFARKITWQSHAIEVAFMSHLRHTLFLRLHPPLGHLLLLRCERGSRTSSGPGCARGKGPGFTICQCRLVLSNPPICIGFCAPKN